MSSQVNEFKELVQMLVPLVTFWSTLYIPGVWEIITHSTSYKNLYDWVSLFSNLIAKSSWIFKKPENTTSDYQFGNGWIRIFLYCICGQDHNKQTQLEKNTMISYWYCKLHYDIISPFTEMYHTKTMFQRLLVWSNLFLKSSEHMEKENFIMKIDQTNNQNPCSKPEKIVPYIITISFPSKVDPQKTENLLLNLIQPTLYPTLFRIRIILSTRGPQHEFFFSMPVTSIHNSIP